MPARTDGAKARTAADGAADRSSDRFAGPTGNRSSGSQPAGSRGRSRKDAGGGRARRSSETTERAEIVADAAEIDGDHPGDRAALTVYTGRGSAGRRAALAVMPTLDEQAERAASTLAGAKARSTLRAYRAGWNDFLDFWYAIMDDQTEDRPELPATAAVVVLYLNYLAHDRRASLPTITQRVAAIRHAHAAAGHPSPTSDPAVAETLRGIRRLYAELRAEGDTTVTIRAKGELRLSALERMIDTCGDDPGGIRDAALLALGFFGAFRRSELAALRLRDVQDTGDRMTVTVTRSKTDQEGAGIVKAFVRRSDSAYCPVRLLRRWLSIRGSADENGFLFVNVGKGGAIGRRGLDGKDVARRLKARADRAGIDTARLGGHSLRIGFVTEARRRGAPPAEIQRQTGHRTERMITHYTRTDDAFEMNAVTRF